MAVSVRLEPLLEKELALAARRLGVSKSQFIVSALEQALGRKNPYELYQRVQQQLPGYTLGSDTAQVAHEDDAVWAARAQSLLAGFEGMPGEIERDRRPAVDDIETLG